MGTAKIIKEESFRRKEQKKSRSECLARQPLHNNRQSEEEGTLQKELLQATTKSFQLLVAPAPPPPPLANRLSRQAEGPGAGQPTRIT